MNHDLKTHPEPFAAVKSGAKTFEFRYCGDRSFAVSDTLTLQEYDPETQAYTGDSIRVAVPYLLLGGQFGIPEDYCLMSITKLYPTQTAG
ncbi:MAG: DUF3850 domain-containing protein [Firmicutes bacterium]|nr:DUF3850 domain-containing protein [Bacillota bacterium]